jgi:hypothetical protein
VFIRYLDVSEVACISKALKHYRKRKRSAKTLRDIGKLIKIFAFGKQYYFDSKKPSEKFKPEYMKLLKAALNAYCNQSPTPPDVAVALAVLQRLSQ